MNLRTKDQYLTLLNILVKIFKIVPGGVLIFFPSYNTIDEFIKNAEKTDDWKGISHFIFKETPEGIVKMNVNNSHVISAKIDDFKELSKSDARAVLFAAARGKISEGINFPDDECRCIIIAGVPYCPPDPYRKAYYDKIGLSYETWYRFEAINTVNQIIGRCFRHLFDYGAVIFLDVRFSEKNIIELFPKWLNEVKFIEKIANFIDKLKNFYSVTKNNIKITENFSDTENKFKCIQGRPAFPLCKLESLKNWEKSYLKNLFFRRIKRKIIPIKIESQSPKIGDESNTFDIKKI